MLTYYVSKSGLGKLVELKMIDNDDEYLASDGLFANGSGIHPVAAPHTCEIERAAALAGASAWAESEDDVRWWLDRLAQHNECAEYSSAIEYALSGCGSEYLHALADALRISRREQGREPLEAIIDFLWYGTHAHNGNEERDVFTYNMDRLCNEMQRLGLLEYLSSHAA
jgi:hypothetical protein